MTKQKQIQTWTYICTYTARKYMFVCAAHIYVVYIRHICVLWSVDLFTSWTCNVHNYIYDHHNIYLELYKMQKWQGWYVKNMSDCNYLIIYSFVSDFEDYFESIFNNLSTRRRQREIDLKSEDIFLNVNSICDEIIAKRVLLVPKKIFPRLHKWVECGFLDPLLNMCSALKRGKNTPKKFKPTGV